MEKHTHKYKRIKVGRNKRIEYKCALPGCNHVLREEYIVGRKSICHRCGEEFIIDQVTKRLAKPHCVTCTDSKDKAKIINILELVSKL